MKDQKFNGKIKDLYGQEVDLDEFGGIFPLAHPPKQGTIKDQADKLLDNDRKLNPIFQKEGHILIGWLRFFGYAQFHQEKVRASDSRKTLSPNYDRVKNILEKKPENDLEQEVCELILKAFDQRLSTLDNLLPIS